MLRTSSHQINLCVSVRAFPSMLAPRPQGNTSVSRVVSSAECSIVRARDTRTLAHVDIGVKLSIARFRFAMFSIFCVTNSRLTAPEGGLSVCPRTSGSGSGWRGAADLTGGTASARTAKRRCRSSQSGRWVKGHLNERLAPIPASWTLKLA